MRGQHDRARAVLQRIRGDDADVDAEFKDIVRAVDVARQNDDGAFRRLFSKEYRHCLAIGVAIPVFYEFTGMIVISIFSPVLFRTVGFNSQKAILGSVINSATNLASTLLSSVVMDRTGRRFLFVIGGLGMMLCEPILNTEAHGNHGPGTMFVFSVADQARNCRFLRKRSGNVMVIKCSLLPIVIAATAHETFLFYPYYFN